jgi:lysophospholipase L1-like esterase
MTKRIMCFGDSLTWGWNPIESGIPIERYSKEKRWTGILASELGPEFEVLEEGLSGRTTNLDSEGNNLALGQAVAGLVGSEILPE